MFDKELLFKAREILDICRSVGIKLTTAESCTGGLISAVLTSVAGSSDVMDGGFITYSNHSKVNILGVDNEILNNRGAVSDPVAIMMAERALEKSNADIAISVTGIAGPGGGSVEKPVGLVYIACARKEMSTISQKCNFDNQDRNDIRRSAILVAFDLIERQFSSNNLLA